MENAKRNNTPKNPKTDVICHNSTNLSIETSFPYENHLIAPTR